MRTLSLLWLSVVALGAGVPEGLAPEEYQRLRALCFRLGENEPGKKWDAARALIREGAKAVPVVKTLLEGDWLEGRRMAAWILSQIRHESAVGPLAKALSDPDEEVRWKAAVGLRRIGKPSVLHLIAVLLGGELPAQHCAAWALGEIADPTASGPLASALESPDEDLRWKAAISLSQIGKPALQSLGDPPLRHLGNRQDRRKGGPAVSRSRPLRPRQPRAGKGRGRAGQHPRRGSHTLAPAHGQRP